MSDKSYPDFEPAWVESAENPDVWALWWLDKDGKPLEPIGVANENEVPGIHTPAAAERILSLPFERQLNRSWSSVRVEPVTPEA